MGTPFTFADFALSYRSALRKASCVAIVFAERLFLSLVTAIISVSDFLMRGLIMA